MELSEIKKHLFIVMCEEHYTPLGVIRALGEYGIHPHVIIIESKIQRIASSSKYIDSLHKVASLEEGCDLLLREYKTITPKPFVIPCDDHFTSYLDKRYEELKPFFYLPNAKETTGRITFFQEKLNINIMAEKHGFNVAKTWIVENGEVPEDIEYPVITKPLNSNSAEWKEAYHICKDTNELLAAYRSIQLAKLFLQKYIEKKNELCIDGVVISEGNEWIGTASRYTYVLPGGYSAEYICGCLEDDPAYSFFKPKVDSMFKDIGYQGVFELEFLIDKNDTIWFLEENFRASPWMYAGAQLGMNFFLLWAYGILNGKLPYDSFVDIPRPYKGMSELQDFKWRVLTKKISFRKWLAEVKSCDCLAFYNKYDKKPFFTALIGKILVNLRKA